MKGARSKNVSFELVSDMDGNDDIDDFDPEDSEFCGDYEGGMTSKRQKTRASEHDSRQHYHNPTTLKKRGKVALPIDDETFMDGKYAGRKVNKTDLGYVQEEGEDDQNDPTPNWAAEITDEETIQETETSSKRLKEQLEALQDAENLQLEMLAKKTVDDKEKGKHVKEQLRKWQASLELRIKMQSLITLAHRIPSPPVYRTLCEDLVAQKGRQDTTNLINSLCESLLRKCEEHVDDRPGISDMESKLKSFDVNMTSKWKSSLDKWHQKVSLTQGDGLNAKKQLKIINQSLWTQVEVAMRDRDRLLKRAFTRRSSVLPIFDTPGNVLAFDDGDFFSLLVQEWTFSNGGESVTRAAGLIISKVKQHKMGVDPRASKGRKLRYDLQDKLVNYMIPVKDGSLWPDDKIDAFLESIFIDQ